LNKIFIDGVLVPSVLGFPAFAIEAHGLHGAAWATVVSRWLLFALLVWFARKPLAERQAMTSVRLALASNPFGRAAREEWRGAWDVLRRGGAIGAQMFVEFGAFAGMSLIAGRCGTVHAAGHAIIQCLTDVSYVIPLGVGVMGSIKVGQNVGAGSTDGARAAARLAMMRGAVGVAVNAFVFMVFGDKICWWFTNEKSVHDCAVAALPVVALYQAADGLRVVGAGCLRGVGRLGAALISDVIGFWVLGVPIGAYLALGPPNMGMHGLWKGFCFGVVAVMTPIVLKAWGVGGADEKPLVPVEDDKVMA
jgi:MATE family multidrug resistance protein